MPLSAGEQLHARLLALPVEDGHPEVRAARAAEPREAEARRTKTLRGEAGLRSATVAPAKRTTGRRTGAESRHAPRRRAPGRGDAVEPLLGTGESDAAERRLRQVLSGFVDDPRRSVESADALFEEVATALTRALAERRRTLRDGWHGPDGQADTEGLRASLRDYRDVVDRLLHA